MRRCAECKQEYEDCYDACPHCAESPRTQWRWAVIGGLLLLGVMCATLNR